MWEVCLYNFDALIYSHKVIWQIAGQLFPSQPLRLPLPLSLPLSLPSPPTQPRLHQCQLIAVY